MERTGICSVCQSKAPVFRSHWPNSMWIVDYHLVANQPCDGIGEEPETVLPEPHVHHWYVSPHDGLYHCACGEFSRR